ncbi:MULTISPECIES: helix-turn-helix transcriptional regulator [unclassified Streptomyces]|uniref:helix-turn-helix transcriptional regulator n=1 Tax=unclassified Streptomyces TaxID=2593676 RepID=UPI00380C281A
MRRGELAGFLRSRRAALQPEDVGLPRTRRRRAEGLRREEVAVLSHVSTDYYSRIEQQRGPRPSERILAGIAEGLRLSPDERDHLFRLAGYVPPRREPEADGVNPGIRRILDRLGDTPAQIVNHLGETLAQNRPARLLLGDQTRHTGLARSLAYRWFTDPGTRLPLPADEHARHSRTLTAQLLAAHTAGGSDPRVRVLVDALLDASPEFAALWRERPVLGPYCEPKTIHHPDVGPLRLHGESLADLDQSQILTVFTAEPGSPSEERLRRLAGGRT